MFFVFSLKIYRRSLRESSYKISTFFSFHDKNFIIIFFFFINQFSLRFYISLFYLVGSWFNL